MSRYIDDVHKKIYNAIPSSEIDLRQELNDYMASIWNKAPEVRKTSETYLPYYFILQKYIPNIDNLSPTDPIWFYKCRNIFCNLEDSNLDNEEQSLTN